MRIASVCKGAFACVTHFAISKRLSIKQVDAAKVTEVHANAESKTGICHHIGHSRSSLGTTDIRFNSDSTVYQLPPNFSYVPVHGLILHLRVLRGTL